jgi:DNA-binding MarR family transcriptional regulator
LASCGIRCIYTYMKPTADLRECVSCSCFAVRRAARLITQHYDRHLRPAGLRATQFSLLTVLSIVGPLPLSRLADRLGTERTTLTRNLRPLLALGFVTEERADDRRVKRYAITPKGMTAARAALPRWRNAQRSIAASFTPAVLRALDRATAAAAARPVRARRLVGSNRMQED